MASVKTSVVQPTPEAREVIAESANGSAAEVVSLGASVGLGYGAISSGDMGTNVVGACADDYQISGDGFVFRRNP